METDGVLPLCGDTVYSLRVKAAAFCVDCGRTLPCANHTTFILPNYSAFCKEKMIKFTNFYDFFVLFSNFWMKREDRWWS